MHPGQNPLFLQENAIQDLVGNRNINSTRVVLSEAADVIFPNISRVILDFSLGVLTIECSETIDSTPSSLVDLSRLFVSNISGSSDITLLGSTVTPMDGTNVTITLTESARVEMLKISSQRPDLIGDGFSVVFDTLSNALRDVTFNGG